MKPFDFPIRNSLNKISKNSYRASLLYETAKKSSWPVTSFWNRGPLKILNGIKLILDDQGNHLDPYTISLESFRSFRGPLFHKPVPGQELFFAVSYSKLALALWFFLRVHLFAANPMVFRNLLVRLYSVLCGIPQIIEGIPFSYHFPMVHYYYSN